MGSYYSTPSPPIVAQAFDLTIILPTQYFIYNDYYLNIASVDYTTYILTVNQDNTTTIVFSNIYIYVMGNQTFTLYGGTIPNGTNIASGDIGIEPVCLLKGTKILCLIDDVEKYVNIEDIKESTLIKTYNNGYKNIKILAWNIFKNTTKNNINAAYRLHKLSKHKNDNLIDDLYISGQHSILVDNLNQEQIKKIRQRWTRLLKIEDKFLLMAYVSNDFEQIHDNNQYELFHIILDNPSDIKKQFGIWANGILTESMSLFTFNKKVRLLNYYELDKKISGLLINNKFNNDKLIDEKHDI